MGDRERQVRDEAYRLWDEAGRPDGRDDELWYEAEKRVTAGKAEPAAPKSKAKTAKGVTPVVKNAGNGGVAVPVANDQLKPRAGKGAAVDIAPSKPKKKADKPKDEAPATKTKAKPKSKA